VTKRRRQLLALVRQLGRDQCRVDLPFERFDLEQDAEVDQGAQDGQKRDGVVHLAELVGV